MKQCVLVLSVLAACGLPVTVNGKTHTIGGNSGDSTTATSQPDGDAASPSTTTATPPSKFDEQEAPEPKPQWDPQRAKIEWVEQDHRIYYCNEVQVSVPGIYGVETEGNLLKLSGALNATFATWSTLNDAKKEIAEIEKGVRKDRTKYAPMPWNHPTKAPLKPGHQLVGRYYAYTAYDENNQPYDRWGGQGYYTNGARFVVFDFDTDDYGLFIMLFDWVNFGKQTPPAR